ncbi:Arginine-glutamic acid dipeptide repeats protein [Quillaja saponaria]|uniref:Arginine-glutamic acid dipeptide repeats protein n=1 Tax=Quillaja saponaria TaxID=32244 RepID=A0AAD7LBJ0_QUISA|nr:Arginine-glutamic acid dipeptide repeats protein [Quillaja saponaria]
MDAVQVSEIGNCIEEQSDEQSVFKKSSFYDVFGDPEVFPRVGEEYQAEIPPPITETEYKLLRKNPIYEEVAAGGPHDFLVGLAIPIMWIDDERKNNKHEMQGAVCDSFKVPNKIDSSQPECIRETQVPLNCNDLNAKVESLDSTLVNGTNIVESVNINVKQETKIDQVHEKHRGEDHCLVPGPLTKSWNVIEEASFILGLYIFGKNLVQVRRFIGCKNMGVILSFYYGRFYRSDKYCRWREYRKIKSRKCIYGEKIFTGARQQELLSRLVPNVSEEYRKTLLEVSKIFGEGKLLLEEYVSTLKALVGLNALVEAVGIGKGKKDLTGTTVEALKHNQVLSCRPEIPVGKACSFLTPQEITNFLTGGFRLSKARSSDLFWEAVWPRLLARGWHSEHPNSHGYAASSKNSLVFLVPGVTKFSRRKIVKGTHYFDSISDVLSKVASDPGLLELETAVDNDCGSKDDNGWTNETKLDQQTPNQQCHCYLKPRTPNRSVDVMKFTVVDTSLTCLEASKVRELRNLPVGVMKASISESHSEEDEDTSEEKKNSINTVCPDRDETIPKAMNFNIGTRVSSNRNGLENKASKDIFPISGSDSTNPFANISKDKKTDISNETVLARNAVRCKSSRKMGPDGKNPFGPVTKRRRRLTACNHADTICGTGNIFSDSILKQEEASCCMDNLNSSGNVHSQEDPSQQKRSTAGPPSIASGNVNREVITYTNQFGIEQHEKPQIRTWIDLNLPVTPDAEADGLFMTEMTEKQHAGTSKESNYPHSGTNSKCVDNSQPQPDVNPRRHSTRNRPPTTKVLESLAYGFLEKKEKRKSRQAFPRDSYASRPSRRAHDKVIGEASGSGGANSQGEERADCVSNVNGGVI